MAECMHPDSIHPPVLPARWRKSATEENHLREQGIWLIAYKKATGKPRRNMWIGFQRGSPLFWGPGILDSNPENGVRMRSMLWFPARMPELSYRGLNKERVNCYCC